MPIDPAFRQIIASLRQSPEWDESLDLRLLQALWPTLVGASLAASTSVIGIRGSRMLVQVPDRNWERQLTSIRGRLLARVNEPWPNRRINDIGFTYEDQRR